MSARGLIIRTIDSIDQDDCDVEVPFSPGTEYNHFSGDVYYSRHKEIAIEHKVA